MGGQWYTGDLGGVAVKEGRLGYTDGRTRVYWGLGGGAVIEGGPEYTDGRTRVY